VAQLARSIGRSLRLNEDLIEGIALAHDLGHTPFGHAGQDALNICMSVHGGFEHNLQSLRVVDTLEQRYARFDGLNLTFEMREGILKHCALGNAQLLESREPAYADGRGGIGARFLLRRQPSLEAQLCNLADEIAYNAHDVDDGVRAGLIAIPQLRDVPLFNSCCEAVLESYPDLIEPRNQKRLLYETIRRLLSAQVHDVIATSAAALAAAAPTSVEEVRNGPPLVLFSNLMRARYLELKQFLSRNVYRHPQVTRQMESAKHVVMDLFAIYLNRPAEMRNSGCTSDAPVERVVADYIAGMTDRFALREHERLTGVRFTD
jgi:dGTPase